MAPGLFILYVAVVLVIFFELLSRLHLESGVGLCMSISTGICFLPQLVTRGFLMIAFLIWNTQVMACFCESTRDMSVLALSTFHVAAIEFGLFIYQVFGYGIVPGNCDNIVVRG